MRAAPDLAPLSAGDAFARMLGIEFVEGGEGTATVAMTVTRSHLNFLGGGHGGAIFALADAAFGLASNSRAAVAVGVDAHIAYSNPVSQGDRLIARASEISRAKRLAVYHVSVERADGTVVATFTGTVYVTSRNRD